MVSDKDLQVALSSFAAFLRSNPSALESFVRSPSSFARPTSAAAKAKPSPAPLARKAPVVAPAKPALGLERTKAKASAEKLTPSFLAPQPPRPKASLTPQRVRSPCRSRSPPRSRSLNRRDRSRSPVNRSSQRSPLRSALPGKAVIPDSPASPDPVSHEEMDTDGFTLVASKGKKRPAAPSSPPPPSKAPCPPSGEMSHPPEAPAEATPTPKVKRPRHLTVRDKMKWEQLANFLAEKGIPFEASSVHDGIKLQLETPDHHREVTRFLRGDHIDFYRFPLEEEKVLRVVIRGIPKEFQVVPIHKDLKSQGFPVLEVNRMYGGRTKVPLDLVLVTLPRTPEAKAIFNLKTVMSLSGLKVETPHPKSTPGQCHRCQLYGHASRFCESAYRCVKCAGQHSTSECTRTRDDPTPPKCVLCGNSGHTANYRGCPKAPKAAKKPGRIPPARNPPRSQGSYSKLQIAPPKAPTYVDAPIPTTNAWSKPSGTVQVAPPPPPTPAQAPARTTTQGLRAPPPKPPKRSPVPPGPSDLKADLELLTMIANSINPEEVTKVAQEVRACCNNPVGLLCLMEEHKELFSALKRLSPPSQPFRNYHG